MAEPGFAQRVGEERKSAGLALDLPDQQVGQPVLEDEPVLARGRLDRLAQRPADIGPSRNRPRSTSTATAGEGGEVAGMVGSQGEDDAPALGVGDQSLEEPTHARPRRSHRAKASSAWSTSTTVSGRTAAAVSVSTG